MQPKWSLAADMLEAAARTIRERSQKRDSGAEDTIDMAAAIACTSSGEVLTVLLALKDARYHKAGDYDSAVDRLAYQARDYAEDFYRRAKPETDGFKPGPPIDPPEHAPPPIMEALDAREADTPADMGLNAEAAYRCATEAQA